MEQPKIPTLKDAQKPQVKLKGLGAGLTMLDRLKQFKKKDLAFILAGLGTLFMAPLAEHFMMSPENGDGQLQQGWGGGRSGASLFGSGGSPYEGGLNGISQGGAIGGGGDIITPLNVRDPSALIMGPGSSQQPPAGAATPPTPPPTAPARSDSDMRDALAASAARAATAATKKAPLPVPKVALGGSGLRGLGAASGGSSSSAGLGPIAGGPRSAASGGGGGLNMVRAAPGYRGAAGARGSANPTGLDNVKKAAGQAGDAFSRTGNAMSGLQEAAGQNIPQGGSGFGGQGQGGAGPNDKGPGGSGPGGSKSVGESLAFIAAKQRMEKELELEFEKRKKGDPELLWYDIRNEMLKTIANKGIAEPLAEAMKGIVGSGAAGPAADAWSCDGRTFPPAYPTCSDTKKDDCLRKDGTGVTYYIPIGGQAGSGILCHQKSGSSKEKPKADELVSRFGPSLNPEQAGALANLKAACAKLNGQLKGGMDSGFDTLAKSMLTEARQLAAKRDALAGKSDECAETDAPGVAAKPDILGAEAKSLKDQHTALATMALGTGRGEGANQDNGLLGKMSGLVDQPTGEVPAVADYEKAVNDAKAALKKIVDTKVESFTGSTPRGAGKTDKETFEHYQEIIRDARGAIRTLEKQYTEAQELLDEDVLPIVKGTGGESGSLSKVIAMNLDFEPIKADFSGDNIPVDYDEPGEEPAEIGTAADAARVAAGKALSEVRARAKDLVGVQRVNAIKKIEEETGAKAKVMGVRKVQSEVLADAASSAGEAKSKVGL